MDINANINIDDTQLNELVSIVKDSLDLTDDIESYLNDNVDDHVKTSIDDHIGDILDDRIESYFEDNLDSAVERAVDRMDLSSYFDAEAEARNLLNSYDPASSCSTGVAFRDAVASTIAYLQSNDEAFKNEILNVVKNSVADIVKSSIADLVNEQLSKGISSQIKREVMLSLNKTFSSLVYS